MPFEDDKNRIIEELTLVNATIEKLITAGMDAIQTEIPLYQLKSIPISKEERELYRRYMNTLIRKTNQDFYRTFMSKNIDFIPVYLSMDQGNFSVRLHIRRDFLEKKLKISMGFPAWLRSNKSLGRGIPHRYKKAKQAQNYLDVLSRDPDGRQAEKDRPRWWKKYWRMYVEEYGKTDGYKPTTSKANRSEKIHGTGLPISQGRTPFKKGYEIEYRTEEIRKVAVQFIKPIQWNSLKKILDPDVFTDLFGDNNQKAYIKKYQVDTAVYNDIMKKVLTKYNEVLMHIQSDALNDKYVTDYENSYRADFPNISRIRNWYIKKGMNNPDKKGSVVSHTYTMDNFAKLKSNKARANFIDRATFVIANSIYAKMNGEQTSKITGNPYSPTPFRKGLTSGKKIVISKARLYKKTAKGYKKYQTERTKKYTQWQLDNRKMASNIKRRDNRSRRQT